MHELENENVKLERLKDKPGKFIIQFAVSEIRFRFSMTGSLKPSLGLSRLLPPLFTTNLKYFWKLTHLDTSFVSALTVCQLTNSIHVIIRHRLYAVLQIRSAVGKVSLFCVVVVISNDVLDIGIYLCLLKYNRNYESKWKIRIKNQEPKI